MTFTEAQLGTMLATFLWPFFRVAALIATAPVFNSRQVPARFKVMLALAITAVIAPTIEEVPAVSAFSFDGMMITLQQVAIGVCIGFSLQLVFGALIFGGQAIAYSMGLGFAFMMDPQNGVQVPVVSQYYVIMAMLLMLALNIHLVFVEFLAESFHVLPIAVDGITRNTLWELAGWASRMFAAGLLMALPVIAALLLVNVGMGVVTRASPQLNIFAVGFPMTLTFGLVLIWVTLPDVLANFGSLVNELLATLARLLAGG